MSDKPNEEPLLDESTENILDALTWMPDTNMPATINNLRRHIRYLVEEARSNAVVDFLKDKNFTIGGGQ